MITPRQIRAARGLLGWDAIELGKRSSLRRETVANIESGRTRASDGSLERILKAFDGAGVTFGENESVGIKPEGIETFIGSDRFEVFTEFVYDYVQQHGGNVCISAVHDALVGSYRDDWSLFLSCLQDLHDLAAHENATFHILPADGKTATAFCAFGGCLALISFDHQPAPYVVLHKSSSFGVAFRDAVGLGDTLAQHEVREKRA
jgi:transcriptional regulator with XRE-family HTH domain